jgi:protoheme IX farnesyltransferase
MTGVIASACVYNNYIDRDIDALMERTKERALVVDLIPPHKALAFASLLLFLGGVTLLFYTNILAFAVALFGFVMYVFAYSFTKRITMFSTHIGAIAGAVPPVVGYVAVTASLDKSALALFSILFTWQMVHFFAIAIYRLEEYKAAKIPLLPVQMGIYQTKIQMVLYASAFAILAPVPTQIGLTGYLYGLVMTTLSLGWLALTLWGFRTKDEKKWALRMFYYSLAIILAFAILLMINWRGSLL